MQKTRLKLLPLTSFARLQNFAACWLVWLLRQVIRKEAFEGIAASIRLHFGTV
jgi:hypothetical protein